MSAWDTEPKAEAGHHFFMEEGGYFFMWALQSALLYLPPRWCSGLDFVFASRDIV